MNYSNLSYPQSNKDEVDILKTIKNINKEFPNMSTEEILKLQTVQLIKILLLLRIIYGEIILLLIIVMHDNIAIFFRYIF